MSIYSRDKDGYVYAVYEEGTPLVKIGHTGLRLQDRLASIRSQYHVSLWIAGSVWIPKHVHRVEHALHRYFASSRIEGEWFYLHINQNILESLVEKILLWILPVYAAYTEAATAYDQWMDRRTHLNRYRSVLRPLSNSLYDCKRAIQLGPPPH